MIRLGVVDFDSSHSIEFAKRLNHKGIAQEQWVDGAEVVIGCSLPSAISEQSKVDLFAREFQDKLGLPLVAKPEDMIGKIDGVLIESVDGSVHLDRARPFIEAGITTYIDKPYTCSTKDAREILTLAAKHKVAIFSASSLRYAAEVTNLLTGGSHAGKIIGVDAYSPGPTHPRNPGLFHYGVHGVETLYQLMGPGCKTLRCVSTDDVDFVTGQWEAGRIGTVRANRAGTHDYGFTAFCEKAIVPAKINAAYIYRELLKQIVTFFEKKQSPLTPAELFEPVAFMEAAIQSAAKGGAPTPLASLA